MLDKNIKRIAVQWATLMFFVMAVVGWVSGLSPYTSGMRAVGGFIAVYCLIRLAGTIIISVLVQAMANEQIRQHRKSDQE